MAVAFAFALAFLVVIPAGNLLLLSRPAARPREADASPFLSRSLRAFADLRK
jgi:hypothetical protein